MRLNVFYASVCFSVSPAAVGLGCCSVLSSLTLKQDAELQKTLPQHPGAPEKLRLSSLDWKGTSMKTKTPTLEGSSDTHKDDLLKKLWPRLALLVCQDVKFQKYSDSGQLQERSRLWNMQSTYVLGAGRHNNTITRDHHEHQVTFGGDLNTIFRTSAYFRPQCITPRSLTSCGAQWFYWTTGRRCRTLWIRSCGVGLVSPVLAPEKHRCTHLCGAPPSGAGVGPPASFFLFPRLHLCKYNFTLQAAQGNK